MVATSDRGVPCFSGSCSEIYRENAFPLEWRPERPLPVAAELGETSLMLQVHPTLSQSDMYDIAAAVAEVMGQATT